MCLKLHALNRISRFLSSEQHVLITNAYKKCIFNYCSLVWMFCYRGIMHKMNKIHKRSLRFLLKNDKDDLQDLLKPSGDISIHQRCKNSLLTELCNYIIDDLSPEIMNEVICTTENIFNIRQLKGKLSLNSHTYLEQQIWIEFDTYKANQLWNLLPEHLKLSLSLTLFKNKITLRNCFNCPYDIATKIFAIWLATRTSIFAASVLHCSANMRKKFKITDSQRQPENQLKQHVLVWATATLLIRWKLNSVNLSANSETGTPCIDIKTFELNFQLNSSLNFEIFDVNLKFFMPMSHGKSEITKTKHEEQVWNVMEMYLMMTCRSLWISRKIKISLKRQWRLIICLSLREKWQLS